MPQDKRTPGGARTRRTRKTRTTEDWAPRWLEAFRSTGTVKAACEVADVGRSTVYDRRGADEVFAAAWAEAEAEIVETMEREAYRRAVEGVEEPLVSAGKLVTTARRFSDTLLIFLLKARRPEMYRDNVKIEHSGEVTRNVKVDLSKLDGDELDALERISGKLAEA